MVFGLKMRPPRLIAPEIGVASVFHATYTGAGVGSPVTGLTLPDMLSVQTAPGLAGSVNDGMLLSTPTTGLRAGSWLTHR